MFVPQMDVADLIVCALSCTEHEKLYVEDIISNVQDMFRVNHPCEKELTSDNVLSIIHRMVYCRSLKINKDNTMELILENFDEK